MIILNPAKFIELSSHLDPMMFGAEGDAISPDNGTPDTPAIEACKLSCFQQKKPMILTRPYRYAPSAPWDLTGQDWGFDILGTAQNYTGFILDTGFELAFEGANSFYGSLQNFRVWGNRDAGAVFRIGKDDRSDFFNGKRVDRLTINNTSVAPTMEVVRVNGSMSEGFNATINGGGTGRLGNGQGKALVIRHVANTRFDVNCGQALIGISLENGYIFGNNFVGNVEEVGTAISITSPNAARNTWLSGQYAGLTVIDAQAGSYNVFESAANRVHYEGGRITDGEVGLYLREAGD